MLTELCAELKNYFLRDRDADIHYGEYTISGGGIDLPFLLNGQYFRIVGSVLNDGVYKYPAYGLTDEVFTGAVWAMAVPPAVVALAADIEAWNEKNAETLASPYTSESFGGYSYTKASGSSASGGAYSWKDQFASRLAKWRRLSVL
jgi:hypothetical protein